MTSDFSPFSLTGTIVSVRGSTILARLPQGSVGDLCWIQTRNRGELRAQIVSFEENIFSLALFDEPEGISPGAQVRTHGSQLAIPVSTALLGTVISPLGIPFEEVTKPLPCSEVRSIFAPPPMATKRPLITKPLITGIRSIDGFCRIGQGQRVGICAPAGIGKSTLLGMIARRAEVDAIVVALVGERSREVREFIEETLGEEGRKRSVVVVATSSDSSLLRQTAPYTATTIAEYLRDQGLNVLLIVDSITRFARAVRETSIAAGDLPVRHGYTNAVYTQLPRLVERPGTSCDGSITALYTVLTTTEEDIDPLADEVKSLLDGHIVLAKEIANLGIMPAVDITQSISRLTGRLTPPHVLGQARAVQRAVARYLRERDIALLGGSPDAELQNILRNQEMIRQVLSQDTSESSSLEVTEDELSRLCSTIAPSYVGEASP
jgi:FliI/YscN family ATPase